MSHRRVVVFGNEKGGAGKSTIALHVAVSLLHAGRNVAIIDLDLRQRSLGRFFANRKIWAEANSLANNLNEADALPHAYEPFLAKDPSSLSKLSDGAASEIFDRALNDGLTQCDIVLVDTPGGDSFLSRRAHAFADMIITPMNDSFIDFDLLGEIDPLTLDVLRPSIYSQTVWDARKNRAVHDGASIDWVVLRNRLASTEARNRKRVDERVQNLSKRVGFRMAAGLRDRVIYRELFPFGLTVMDLSSKVRPVAVSLAHVSARQELRALMAELNIESVHNEASDEIEPLISLGA